MDKVFNFSSLLGLTYALLGIAYFVFMIVFLSQFRNRITEWALPLYLIQLVLIPLVLTFVGALLFFLNSPIHEDLQVVQFLTLLIIIFLLGKDVLVNLVDSNR
ncbi:MAG TPA: hypothetical protein VK184_01520 [Nostocaceae cyanobacterium]|nr:hypothetical protein [Nostocaceae cyanobacterium]